MIKPNISRNINTESKLLKPVYSVGEIPDNMSEEDVAEFWSQHEVTSELIVEDDDSLPPVRRTDAKNINIRIDLDLLIRLKSLARKRRKPYQSLMKEFLIERLYEEEKYERQTHPGNLMFEIASTKHEE